MKPCDIPVTDANDIVWVKNKLIQKEEEVEALLCVVDKLLDRLVTEKMKNRMHHD